MVTSMRRPTVIRRIPARPVSSPKQLTDARWEWRMFRRKLPRPRGTGFIVEAPEPIAAETYLLSPRSSFDVAIRHGHLEIKRLERVDEFDLEQWRLIHRLSFPLSPADVATVCVDLGVQEPPLTDAIGLNAFLGVMRATVPPVAVVPILKRRMPFRFGGCQGRHVSLTVGASRWQELVLEDEDSTRLHSAVQALGYSTGANVNCPQALKFICGLHDPTRAEPVETG